MKKSVKKTKTKTVKKGPFTPEQEIQNLVEYTIEKEIERLKKQQVRFAPGRTPPPPPEMRARMGSMEYDRLVRHANSTTRVFWMTNEEAGVLGHLECLVGKDKAYIRVLAERNVRRQLDKITVGEK